MTDEDRASVTRRGALASLAVAAAASGGLVGRGLATSASRERQGVRAGPAASANPTVGWPMFGNNPQTTCQTTSRGPEEGVQVALELDITAEAPPAVADETMYVPTAAGVTTVDLGTRERDWVAETESPVTTCPAVGDDTVFVGTEDGTMYGFNQPSGTERWTYEADDAVTAAPTYLGSDNWVYFATAGGTAYMLDAATAATLWDQDEIDPATGAVTVATETSTAYVSQTNGTVTGLDDELGSTNRYTFAPGRSRGAEMTPVAFDERRAYVADDAGNLYQFNSRTGELHWHQSLTGGVRQAVASRPNEVYAATDEGHVYAYESNDDDEAVEQWHVELDHGITGVPVIAEGRSVLYLSGEESTVYALDLSDGAEFWSAQLSVGEAEVVVFDGTLWVVGDGVVALDSGPETDLTASTPTPTPTPTETSTATESPTPTQTETPSPTPTATESPTPTPTATGTPTPTPTESPTSTSSPTADESPASTETPAPTPTPTESPTASAPTTTVVVDDTPPATETNGIGPLSPWLTFAGLGGLAVLARWRGDDGEEGAD